MCHRAWACVSGRKTEKEEDEEEAESRAEVKWGQNRLSASQKAQLRRNLKPREGKNTTRTTRTDLFKGLQGHNAMESKKVVL